MWIEKGKGTRSRSESVQDRGGIFHIPIHDQGDRHFLTGSFGIRGGRYAIGGVLKFQDAHPQKKNVESDSRARNHDTTALIQRQK